MKILMIGHTGAGKTSFMAGMYRNLGNKTTGYGIYAINESQRNQLERTSKNLESGIYPAGTDIQSTYQFEFRVNNKVLMPFEWVDYRGGALYSTNNKEAELQILMSQINNCDALIVFLDGTKLTRNSWDNQTEYDVILSCIHQALRQKRTFWFPVSFVVTKFDTLSEDDKLIGLKYFESFFSQCNNSADVHAMLSKSIVNAHQFSSTLYPLLFSIYGGTPNYIQKVKKEEERYWREYQSQKPTSFLGKLFAKVEDAVENVVHEVTDWECFWVTTNDKVRSAQASWHTNHQLLDLLKKEAEGMGTQIKALNNNKIIKIYGR